MVTTILKLTPVAQSQAQLWAMSVRHEFVLETESSRETVNVPVGRAGRLAGVDASGTASGGLGIMVAVTVAVGALLGQVSNSGNRVTWYILR